MDLIKYNTILDIISIDIIYLLYKLKIWYYANIIIVITYKSDDFKT